MLELEEEEEELIYVGYRYDRIVDAIQEEDATLGLELLSKWTTVTDGYINQRGCTSGRSLLHEACFHGLRSITNYLLDELESDVTLPTMMVGSPLFTPYYFFSCLPLL